MFAAAAGRTEAVKRLAAGGADVSLTAKVVDISAVVRLAASAGALTVVDNTFATPFLQRPLELGADIVMHSATKYLSGHSDVISGLLATRRVDLEEKLRFHQNAAGAVPSPFDCWLVMRGMRTVAVRMERASANAAAIAEYLDIRDDRVQRYFSLRSGESIFFETRLNAAYLGRYYLPGASIEAMYDAKQQARLKGQWVEVVAPQR